MLKKTISKILFAAIISAISANRLFAEIPYPVDNDFLRFNLEYLDAKINLAQTNITENETESVADSVWTTYGGYIYPSNLSSWVCIGQSTCSNPFEVSGNSKVNGNLYITGISSTTGNQYVTGTSTITGNSYVGGASYVVGNSTAMGGFVSHNTEGLARNVNNDYLRLRGGLPTETDGADILLHGKDHATAPSGINLSTLATERVRVDNTGLLTAYFGIDSTLYKLSGNDINQAGVLSNVAYENQANYFTSATGNRFQDIYIATGTNKIAMAVDYGNMTIYGGTSGTSGGNISLFGTTHGTAPSQLRFYTGGSERIRIGATGSITLKGDTTLTSSATITGAGGLGVTYGITSATATATSSIATPELCLDGDCQTEWPQGGFTSNVETLAGDKTLGEDDDYYQFLNPNTSYRTITLSTGVTAGKTFHIQNSGNVGQYLRIVDASGNYISRVYGGASGGHEVFIYHNATIGWKSKYHAGVRIGRNGADATIGSITGEPYDDDAVAIGTSPKVSYRGVSIGSNQISATGNYNVLIGYYADGAATWTTSVGYQARSFAKAASTIGAWSSGTRAGEFAHRFYAIEDAYKSPNWTVTGLCAQPTDDTSTTLSTDGSSGRFVLSARSGVSVEVNCVARSTSTHNTGYFRSEALIKRDNSNNTVLVSSATLTAFSEVGTWSMTVDADDTNEALTISVVGSAAEQTYWGCKVDGVEVYGP